MTRAVVLAAAAALVSVWTAPALGRPTVPPAANGLLRTIEAGLSDSLILKSRAAAAPRTSGRPGQPWLYFTTDAGTPVDYVRGYWQAELVTGQFAAEAESRGWPALAGTTISVREASGRERVDDESAFGGGAPVRASAASALTALARKSVAAAGLRAGDLTFSRPNGQLALEITAVAANPKAWLARGLSRATPVLKALTQPGGKAAPCEGVFLLVTDASGEWISANAVAARTLTSLQATNGAFG